MKYSAEVDSEKRNKSPRNDLLRNRKCVGIIQAAKAHTQAQAQARLRIYNDDGAVPMRPDARASSGPRTDWVK